MELRVRPKAPLKCRTAEVNCKYDYAPDEIEDKVWKSP